MLIKLNNPGEAVTINTTFNTDRPTSETKNDVFSKNGALKGFPMLTASATATI